MKKIIVFDLDDTLTDNSILDFYSFKIPLKQLGIKNSLTKNNLQKMRKQGKLAKDILNFILKENQKHLKKQILLIRNFFLYSSKSNNYLKLKSYTKSLFQTLKQKNVQIFLISVRNEQYIIKHFLKKNKLDIFDKIFCNENLSFNLDNKISQNRILIKSSLLHNILKNFGNVPQNIIYIGNSLEDMEAAKNINTKFIYFQNHYLPNESIRSKFTVKSNNELQKLIPKMMI